MLAPNRLDMTARYRRRLVKTSSSPISRPLIVLVPHTLGPEEARRRLDGGIWRVQRELRALLSGLDYHWQEDTLNFSASAMWQRITGRIEVLDVAVRVEIELPWVMRPPRYHHETSARARRGITGKTA